MLCSALELDRVLELILTEARKLFKAEAGSIMLLQDEFLQIRKAVGLSPEIIAKTRVRLGEGIAGSVAQSGRPVCLQGMVKAGSSAFTSVVERKEEIRSSMCVPLRVEGEIIGVLMVRNGGGGCEFSDRDLEACQLFAEYASIALRNARLFDDIERSRRCLGSVMDSMADGALMLDADGSIMLCNAAAKRMLGAENCVVGRSFASMAPTYPWEHVRQELSENPHKLVENELVWNGAKSGGIAGAEHVFRVSATALEDEGAKQVLLFHDISARVEIDRAKTQFVASISHEFQTPISAILGSLELMLSVELPRAKNMKYLGNCKKEGERLQRLVKELLLEAKLESQNLSIRKNMADAVKLVSRETANFAERYPQFRFIFSCNEASVILYIDELLFAQVIGNLLSNSVKYSSAPGPVEVRCVLEDGCAKFSVSDRGKGIAPEHLPFIFDKFYRADNALTRQMPGTGLGLANTRMIVQNMGGAIWADSEEGVGTTFTFTIPLPRSNKNSEVIK